MTKEELRTSYVNQGWEVQSVADWRLVSSIEGKVKYDVLAVSPENVFGVTQVVVTANGEVNETATAEGFWKTRPSTFMDALRNYIRSLEAGTVFATAIKESFDTDEVATVNAYFTDGSVKTFVVKRRNNMFTHKQLV